MLDSSNLDRHDEGRGGRTCTSTDGKCKLLGVVGNNHAQEEDGKAVEEQDPVEGELDSARDCLAWVLRLADSYSNQLSTKVGKNGIDQGSPKAVELS